MPRESFRGLGLCRVLVHLFDELSVEAICVLNRGINGSSWSEVDQGCGGRSGLSFMVAFAGRGLASNVGDLFGHRRVLL